jgi:transposase-like protein
MKPKYNEAFREQAVQKLLQRGDKTISCIAEELNINVFTLKNWLKQYRPHTMSEHKTTKRPIDWTPEERLQALMASHGMEEADLNAFCRTQGVFPHHLKAWRQAFINGTHPASQAPSDKSLRDENKQLKKELQRKEKALAEAAALLVLQKKFQAFWEEKAS